MDEQPEQAPESALSKLRGNMPAFALAYVENGNNATQAAITAGYSEKGAKKQGWELLQRDDVKAAISELRIHTLDVMETSIEDFARDILIDIRDAKAAGAHTAVPKSRELFGKVVGHIKDIRELRLSGSVALEDTRSDDELMAIAAAWAVSKAAEGTLPPTIDAPALPAPQGGAGGAAEAQDHPGDRPDTPAPPLAAVAGKSVPSPSYKISPSVGHPSPDRLGGS